MTKVSFATALVVAFCAGRASASIFIETVPVGNPGNAADTRYDTPGFGAVNYTFNMGKYETTAGQYTEFLNAVAATDTYGLYNGGMGSTGTFGVNIQRDGSPGSYTYSVASDCANRPVNWVSWGDAARFANWLHNGQPTGAQDLSTTEDGSYFLNGATSDGALMAVTRKANWQWAIPTEDEWYKAAYHKNDGVTGNYWDYPTGTDAVPSNDLVDPDPGNNANFYDPDFTIGPPYWRTEVGEFENSDSPYGTFDQGGNIWEWTEGIPYASFRGLRGGSNFSDHELLWARFRSWNHPTDQRNIHGFRVAEVPEPSSLAMLAFAGARVFGRRRGRANADR